MRQNLANTPASVHYRKRRYADNQEQITVPSSVFHCMLLRCANKMACIAARLDTRGQRHPNGYSVGAASNGTRRSQSAPLIRQPSSRLPCFMAVSLDQRNSLRPVMPHSLSAFIHLSKSPLKPRQRHRRISRIRHIRSGQCVAWNR